MMLSVPLLIAWSIGAMWWATGDYRDDSEAWYEVVAEGGVELVERPEKNRGRLLELFLPGKVMMCYHNIVAGLYVWFSVLL